MNVAWILASTALCVSASPAPSVPLAQNQHLERVSPQEGAFDHRKWEERLAARDLDQRERAFGELVDVAVADEAAHDALRAWSTDAGRPDLAWTARLALREVERRPGRQLRALKQFGGGAMQDLRGRFDELEDRFGGLDSMFDDLQRDLDRMFSGAAPRPHSSQGGQLRRESQSFRMQVGPDGVSIEVDEDVDGQRTTRTYTGESLEEVLEANPELRDRVGQDFHIQGFRGQGIPWGLGFGGNGRGPTRGAPAPSPGEPRGLFTPDDDERWSTPAKPLAPNAAPAKMRTDLLGVRYTKPSAEELDRRGLDDGVGLEVQTTEAGTIAAALGVQAGDVLIRLNDRPLKGREDVVSALRERKPGDPVKLELVDAQGRRHTLTWNES